MMEGNLFSIFAHFQKANLPEAGIFPNLMALLLHCSDSAASAFEQQ